jgi:hypothetical protein
MCRLQRAFFSYQRTTDFDQLIYVCDGALRTALAAASHASFIDGANLSHDGSSAPETSDFPPELPQ